MKIFRFLYLNQYAILLAAIGIVILLAPLYKIMGLLFIIQILIAIMAFKNSSQLFSTWNDKQRVLTVLINRNKSCFRADTFKIYMQAPCSRLIVRSVLRQLHLQEKYKELKIYQQPLMVTIQENIKPVKTTIYINEVYI
jgi:uncharacterized membrane protein YkvI